MAKLNEQSETLFNEWLDNIEKEIARLKMDNIAKAKEILALRNVIRENENKLDAIKVQIRMSAYEIPDIERKADYAHDYATYIVDMIDKIKDYNFDKDEDEDDEPYTCCDYCGEPIWDEADCVYGGSGVYCCETCMEHDDVYADDDEAEAE